ncbi:MAG: hypothetical protein J7J91_08970 [Deltaproteobacteria bacterium]|nr:hypothetical protein [Deltaproteobacteria bacterium]
MAFYTKLEGPALDAWRATQRILVARAMKELKLGRDEIVVRDLIPQDLGLSTPVFTFNISSTGWNTIVNETAIADNRFISINGILLGESGTSVVTQLKVTRAGQDVRYWHIQDINYMESPIVYFDDPITVDQNTTITIKAYATATDSDWRCTFLGKVVERKGLLVV